MRLYPQASFLLLFVLSSCSVLPEGPGAPVGPSTRAGQYIVTLRQHLAESLPALHRNPDNDRYRLSLLLHSVPTGESRSVTLASGLRASDYIHAARFLGDDGQRVWFHAHQILAYDYLAHRLLRPADLTGLREPRSTTHFPRLFPRTAPADFLSRTESFGPQFPRAATVLQSAGGKPLALTSPDSFLLSYRLPTAGLGTLHLSRRTPDAKTLWTTDTRLQHLEQILPAPDFTACIGQEPLQSPNEVRPPILVIVNNTTGQTTRHSLWAP